MWRLRNQRRVAFTLVELLVVIAIMAVLLTLITPALQKAREKARLVLCANNQHQLVLGLTSYAVENEGKFPPSHVERKDLSFKFTWANHINYHCDEPLSSYNNGGAAHAYLGKYIESVQLFICPLAPPVDLRKYEALYTRYDDPLVINQYGGGNPDITTTSSYNMFWGGYSLPYDHFDLDGNLLRTRLEGAKSMSSKGKLLVSDLMNYWSDSYNGTWWLAHPTDNALPGPEMEPLLNNTSTSMVWYRHAAKYDYPLGLPLHAGYTDGHVDRYYSEETLFVDVVQHRFYFPKEWR
jgi:prepilin-type N-terminal cleavage/methylation domain-containing protein